MRIAKEGRRREAEGLKDLWKKLKKLDSPREAGVQEMRFPSGGDDEGVGPIEKYWA